MELQEILRYLTELSLHNERPWYHAHKTELRSASELFEKLIQALIFEIGQFDESVLYNDPKRVIFKVVKDMRYSRDGLPYRAAFRAHIAAKGKLPVPVGYFVLLEPGDRSFLAAGLFTEYLRDATLMVREYMDAHREQWGSITRDSVFTEYFGFVRGKTLKNVPKGYDKDHPLAEDLKKKNWYVKYPIADAQITDISSFLDLAGDAFFKMKPLNDYLNTALDGYELPPDR